VIKPTAYSSASKEMLPLRCSSAMRGAIVDALNTLRHDAVATVSQHGANTNVMLRARDAQKLALAKREVEEMLERAASTIE
jgi:hypothetical protein